MYKVHVRDVMKFLKEDVHVLVNSESKLEQLYYGTIKNVPYSISDMVVKSQCFDIESDEPMIAILVYG